MYTADIIYILYTYNADYYKMTIFGNNCLF